MLSLFQKSSLILEKLSESWLQSYCASNFETLLLHVCVNTDEYSIVMVWFYNEWKMCFVR